MRRVGFELEFAGLELPVIADILAETLGGSVRPNHHAECIVTVDDLGEFMVELDWKLIKEVASERASRRNQLSEDEEDRLLEWFTYAASQVVPSEIVCPPIEIERLNLLNPVVERLRDAGALGTDKALIYAFGVHINPELPDLEANTIIDYIKAYCLAQDWLLKAHDVDPVRRITPYIDLYPKKYIRHVLAYRGDESMAQIIDDYLQYNPTRNRALDLLPLFRHIDEARVDAVIDDDRVNSRPTFHYRMPNCEIEKPHWDLTVSWNIWCVLEKISEDERLIDEMTAQWYDYDDAIIKLDSPAWFKTLDDIHQDLLSA